MDLKEAIVSIRPTIVQIRVRDSLYGTVNGTGFFVSEDALVATAWHVVEDYPDALLVGLAYENTRNIRKSFTLVEATVEAHTEELDLAILRLAENPFREELSQTAFGQPPCAVATLGDDRPDDGEPIAISGYPLDYGLLITTSGAVAAGWASEIYGEFTPPEERTGPPRLQDLFVADVQANPGNSGGPAYRLADGAVIGVCLSVAGAQIWDEDGVLPELADAGLTLLRPIGYVLELMQGSGI